MYRVTDKGKAAILEFLHRSHINGPDHEWPDEELEAWCEEAEANDGVIELRSFECWQRWPTTLTLTGDQLDEIEEVDENITDPGDIYNGD